MYWRRFAVSSIPVDDAEAFDKWVMDTWRAKDEILEYFAKNGRFPADESAVVGQDKTDEPTEKSSTKYGFLETEVKLKSVLEIGQLFVPAAAFWMAWRLYLRAKEVLTVVSFVFK